MWHRPPCDGKRGASLQFLQAPLLAKLLNRPVVHDFRAADLAQGGQGAPLVPALDEALLGRVVGWRAVLNLGGIANLTLIPPSQGPDHCESVLGWDIGPANSLIDLAIQKITNGKLMCDIDGAIAASGSPYLPLIERWLNEPFFKLSPPKSTGRDNYGLDDLERRFNEMSTLSEANIMSTLTTFSAAVVAQEFDNLATMNLIRPQELLLAGGGARNLSMQQELFKRCRGIRISTIEAYGIPFEAREALAFALLTWWHVLKFPGNSPKVTGAKRAVVLGTKALPR